LESPWRCEVKKSGDEEPLGFESGGIMAIFRAVGELKEESILD
jgi:hypothetical protein